MRALHLNFLLHYPYSLHGQEKWDRGYFGGEANFKQYNADCCLPMLALLERNAQRYPNLHVSMAVSGTWLEQAERWSPELIRRIHKLVSKGTVQLVTLPYYYSMAAFYSLDELEFQINLAREKYESFFGATSQALVLPGLCCHNHLAEWAEKHGFTVFLAGDAEKTLDWRGVDRLYFAKNCNDLKVAFINQKFTDLITGADKSICTQIQQEVKTEEAKFDFTSNSLDDAVVRKKSVTMVEKTVFSEALFQKQLELEFLRGDLINIYLTPEIFKKWHDYNIATFFDELFKNWAQLPGNRMVGAKDLEGLSVKSEVSIKKTVSVEGESDQAYQLPAFWNAARDENSKYVYRLSDKVLQTDDHDLHLEFSRLTTIDYVEHDVKQLKLITDDFASKIEQYLVENANSTKAPQIGMTVGTKVNVQFDQKARAAKRRREELLQYYREANADKTNGLAWSEDDMEEMEATIQVLAQRVKRDHKTSHNLAALAEAEIIEDMWIDPSVEEDTHIQDSTVDDTADVSEVDELFDETSQEPQFQAEPQEKPHKKRKKIVIS